MNELTAVHWGLLIAGAFVMGLGKGGVPGAGNLTIAIYALVLEDAMGSEGVALSVALLLPVLISADMASTLVYRRSVEWLHIRKLLPSFLLGVLFGWLIFECFQAEERSSMLKVLIGSILLAMTVSRFLTQCLDFSSRIGPGSSIVLGPSLGMIGGMATMLANAAGPIAQFYLLVMKLPKYAFIGTSAWLFLIVNLFKVPFMWELGLLDLEVLSVCVWLFLPAILGAFIAPQFVRYIRDDWFERMIWFFIALAGLRMIF